MEKLSRWARVKKVSVGEVIVSWLDPTGMLGNSVVDVAPYPQARAFFYSEVPRANVALLGNSSETPRVGDLVVIEVDGDMVTRWAIVR